MSRPPRARKKVLDAAERIVKAHGAANLTFEELVQESGISRGGITYHFATKDELLRALIERDLEQGKAEEAKFRAAAGDGPAAELIAQIRAWSRPDADRKRFVAGMLSAVAHDPGLLDPIRCHHQAECAARTWDEAGIRVAILKLAAAGMFWSEFFGCSEVPPEQRPRVIAAMEALAQAWTGAAEPAPVLAQVPKATPRTRMRR